MRYLKVLGLLVRLIARRTPSPLPDEMGQLHGLPQKLGQHFTLYLNPAGERFRPLYDRGASQPSDVLQLLRRKGVTARGPAVCAAQASVGQVFRVPTADFGLVAVKAKYRGVEKHLRTDMQALRTLTGILRLLPVKLPLPSILDTLAGFLLAECDYRLESARQQAVGGLFAGSGLGIAVPPVFQQLSDADVIVSAWAEGPRIDEALESDAEQRLPVLTRLFHFEFLTLLRLNLVHADPHPGNFLVRETPGGERELVALDFGSMLPLEEQEKTALIALLLGGISEAELLDALSGLGFDADVLHEYRPVIGELITIVFEPFYHPGRYSFHQWRLDYKINCLLTSKNFARAFSFPPKLYLFLRMIQGLYYYARRYDVRLDWHRTLRDVLQRATTMEG